MNNFPLPENAEEIMLQAVALAERGKGLTSPNPCVGAVLTRNGRIVAEGYHRGPGQAHAEVEALRDAARKNVDPAGCILWVTLEPCNHAGRTPPCTRAVREAGITRVVVGTADPNPHVLGGGIAHLREHGVEVLVGMAEQACKDLIADFLTWITTPRPYVYLKLASTLDGRIATRSGDSRWISNALSREHVHSLRARVGAVVVGSGTLRGDDPRLTARASEAGQDAGKASGPTRTQPLAVVVGTRLPDARENLFLLRQRPGETIFWTTESVARSAAADELRGLGVRVWGAGADVRADLEACLVRLRSEQGVAEVLCEGGGGLAQQFVAADLVGEWWLFFAPKTLGDARAVPLLAGAEVPCMADARGWRIAKTRHLENDLWLVLRPEGPARRPGFMEKEEDGCSPA